MVRACELTAAGRVLGRFPGKSKTMRTRTYFRLLAAIFIPCSFLGAQTSAFGAQTNYAFTNFVGMPGGAGSVDGVGTNARFSGSWWIGMGGLARDRDGMLYVADTGNRCIRKVTPDGVVTTWAGAPGHGGSVDGLPFQARFLKPAAIAIDRNGWFYVADADDHTIRKISPFGDVTTLAGSHGLSGTNDGSGSGALFSSPMGVAVDAYGTVFVADAGNCTIRKITPGGLVSTLAGYPGISAVVDGLGAQARFHSPYSVAVDSNSNLYVTECFAHVVRKVTANGHVSTLAGLPMVSAFADGQGTAAMFNQPTQISIDGDGMLHIADRNNSCIRKMTPEGNVITLRDWQSNPVRFKYPLAVIDSTWVLCDLGLTLRTYINGENKILAGSLPNDGGINGSGTNARLAAPFGVVVDRSGNLYITDSGNCTIRKATPTGEVSTLAGLHRTPGAADGQGTSALFGSVSDVAIDSQGNLFVADGANHAIRKVTPSGMVTTFAGALGQMGHADGMGDAARFQYCYYLTIDSHDVLYVSDCGNNVIRSITPDRAVTTVVGTPHDGSMTHNDPYRLMWPDAIAVDSSTNIYFSQGNQIRKAKPGGLISPVAGSPWETGYADGAEANARFDAIGGMKVDPFGDLLVTDYGSSTIRKVTPQGMVSTLGGVAYQCGGQDGPGASARFAGPRGVAFDTAGRLYIADYYNNCIYRGNPIITGFNPELFIGLSTNQVWTSRGLVSPVITVTVNETNTPPENLVVTAESSNPSVVPENGLFWEGTGATRRLTVLPLDYGSATVTLTVKSGSNASSIVLEVHAVGMGKIVHINPTPIPLTFGGGSTASLFVPGSDSVAKVTLALLGVTNMLPSNLDAALYAPNWRHVDLVRRTGPSTLQSAAQITFDDGASGALTGNRAITNVVIPPHQALRGLNGPAGGSVWTLCVTNGAASGTPGSIDLGFALTLYYAPYMYNLGNWTTFPAGLPVTVRFGVWDSDGYVTNLAARFVDHPEAALVTATYESYVAPTNGCLVITPMSANPSTNLLEVVATDNEGFSTTNRSYVTFSHYSQAPSVGSVAPQSVAASGTLSNIQVPITDNSSPARIMWISAKSSDQSVIRDQDIQVSPSSGMRLTNCLISLTAQAPAFGGTATITVTVSNSLASGSTSFPVKVGPGGAQFFGTSAYCWGDATPTASTVLVSNVPGQVKAVQVTLRGFTSTDPTNFTALLVDPSGSKRVLLMSRAGGSTGATNVNVTFNQSALQPIPSDRQLVSGTFLPTALRELGFTLPVPAPAGPYESSLDAFKGLDPNGNWTLYLMNDTPWVSGVLFYGWEIGVITEPAYLPTHANTNAIVINDAQAATPFPSTISVANFQGNLGKIRVAINGFNHVFTPDASILLVGPRGQKTVLLRAAGGGAPAVNANLIFDDAAAEPAPRYSQLLSGSYRPSDFLPGGSFYAPAPEMPYSADLSVFEGTDPNGTWSLYVEDGVVLFDGEISGGWSLSLAPAPAISVTGSSLAFGPVAVGDIVERTFTVANPGGEVLSGTVSVQLPFYINGNTNYSVASGSSKAVTVRYHPIAAGTNNAILTFTGGGGTNLSLKGVAYNPPPPLTLAVGSCSGASASTVVLPVRVSGFTNIGTLQASVHWNASQASYLGVEQFGISGLTSASFGEGLSTNGTLTFSWDDPTGSCSSLTNGATLFALRLLVTGTPGSTNFVYINSVPASFEASTCELFPVPTQTSQGSIIAPARVGVLGRITVGATSEGLPNVTMIIEGPEMTTVQSDALGYYSTSMNPGQTYAITPRKLDDTPVTKGVSTLDIALIRRHLLGLAPLDTPQKLLAADVNGSSTLSALDIALIRQFVLGLTNQFPAGLWKFVPATCDFDQLPTPWAAPRTCWYTNLFADTPGQNYCGLKLGDVNDSRATTGTQAAPKLSRMSRSVRIGGACEAARPGSTVTMPIRASNFERVTSAQFSLQWDPAVLRFSRVERFGLPGMDSGSFSALLAREGRLAFAWDDPQGRGITLASETALFQVCFEVLGTTGTSSAVKFTASPTEPEIGVEGEPGAMSTVDGRIIVGERPVLACKLVPTSGAVDLSFQTQQGLKYVLEFNDAVSDEWHPLTGITGDGTVRTWTDVSAGSSTKLRLYRVRID